MRYEVPASAVLLAQLLEPLHSTLHNSLWAEQLAQTRPPLSRTQVRQLFLGIRSFVTEVNWLLNTKIAPLATQAAVDPPALRKAVNRLSDLVDAQLRRYEAVLSSQDASGEGLNELLGEAYRHNLREVRNWMADLIQLAHDPEQFLASGPQDPTTKITLIVEFTSCTAMEQLRERIMPIRIKYKSEACRSTAPSLLAQLGWLILGVGLIQWIFGSDQDA